MTENYFDEATKIKLINKEAKFLLDYFQPLVNLKSNDPDILFKFEKIINNLPNDEFLCQKIRELRDNSNSTISDIKKFRRNNFGRFEADFIRRLESEKIPYRQYDNGWRVGPLYLEFLRDQNKISFYYNREKLSLSPITIKNADDIYLEMNKFKSLLEKERKIPDDLLIETVWQAYEKEKLKAHNLRYEHPEVIPINTFHRAFRAELVDVQLINVKPNCKLKYECNEQYTFLYNMDYYRRLTPPENKRIGFQTGSQNELRAYGYILNGINATEDYKTFCQVISSTR